MKYKNKNGNNNLMKPSSKLDLLTKIVKAWRYYYTQADPNNDSLNKALYDLEEILGIHMEEPVHLTQGQKDNLTSLCENMNVNQLEEAIDEMIEMSNKLTKSDIDDTTLTCGICGYKFLESELVAWGNGEPGCPSCGGTDYSFRREYLRACGGNTCGLAAGSVHYESDHN